jgi:hypothetical protein
VNGVGGVLTGESKKDKRKRKEAVDKADILGNCCCCEAKWDRYIGKKKCKMCGVPVLLCQDCCTRRVDKLPEFDLKMRCPLCVLQHITVPAAEVDFTDNGVHTKQSRRGSSSSSSSSAEGGAGQGAPQGGGGAAAKTVCKWGGGHAKSKKRSRQDDRAKKHLETVACKFGKECSRAGCWFSHD